MRISLRVYAELSTLSPIKGQSEIEVQSNSIEELFRDLGVPRWLVAVVLVNGEPVSLHQQLHDHDLVEMVPFVPGG